MENLKIDFTLFPIPRPSIFLSSETPLTLEKVFTKEETKKRADVHAWNNRGLNKPAIIDGGED
jgi:hypothetical protein